MKKWIILLSFSLLPLMSAAQDASREELVRKTVAVLNDNMLTHKDVSVYYASGFFTSFVILFKINGFDKYSPRPSGVTGWDKETDASRFREIQKGTAKIRKLLLKEFKDPEIRGQLWLVRAETGNPQMVFRAQYQNEYVDFTFREEEVFGTSFEKMDPLSTIYPVYQHILTTWKDCDPEGGYQLSNDKKWILFHYNQANSVYKRDAARLKAQEIGKTLYDAMQSSHVTYIYKKKPYYLASALLGLGIQVTVKNVDTGETDTDRLTTEDILQYCLDENYVHSTPYLNRWELTIPGALSANAEEFGDAITLTIQPLWYDLLGGAWPVDKVVSLLREARKDSRTELGKAVTQCIKTGKPLNVIIRTRFNLQIGGQFTAEQLSAL